MLSGFLQHNVTHPQVADVGDGMKMWTIASNMSEMQIGKSGSGWSYSFGVRRESRNFSR